MFFINKYAPKSTDDTFIHNDILKKLKIMSKDESIPHIIFYGPSGCGKKTTINLFLEMLYNKDVHQLAECTYNVIGSGNSKKSELIKQSNYHIVIDPKNNNFDKYLIQDVVKEYAKRIPLNVFTIKIASLCRCCLLKDLCSIGFQFIFEPFADWNGKTMFATVNN